MVVATRRVATVASTAFRSTAPSPQSQDIRNLFIGKTTAENLFQLQPAGMAGAPSEDGGAPAAPPAGAPRTVYVDGLSEYTREEQIHALFSMWAKLLALLALCVCALGDLRELAKRDSCACTVERAKQASWWPTGHPTVSALTTRSMGHTASS